MKLVKDDTDGLPKEGCNVIEKHFSRSESSNFGVLLLFGKFLTNVSLLWHEASQGGHWWSAKRWIWFKHIFQCLKGQKKVKLWCLTLFGNFLKNCLIIFFISCIQFLRDDIDQLSRDGFDWIIQKVTFKVGKARFGLFSRNYQYYSVVTRQLGRPRSPNRFRS